MFQKQSPQLWLIYEMWDKRERQEAGMGPRFGAGAAGRLELPFTAIHGKGTWGKGGFAGVRVQQLSLG